MINIMPFCPLYLMFFLAFNLYTVYMLSIIGTVDSDSEPSVISQPKKRFKGKYMFILWFYSNESMLFYRYRVCRRDCDKTFSDCK